MQFKFDPEKSKRLKKKRGIGFEEVTAIFASNYYLALKQDEPPEQWRATGWVNAKLYSVVYEERSDEEGSFYWLVTLWKATEEEKKEYENAT